MLLSLNTTLNVCSPSVKLSTKSSNNVILDSDGNRCGTSCDNGKYLLTPESICLTNCDTSIYISDNDNKCGLCKDIDTYKPYKLIGSTECLSEIPNNAEEYNTNSHLLICKSGYILNENNCVPHCYTTCVTCSAYSENEEDQKCLTCKETLCLPCKEKHDSNHSIKKYYQIKLYMYKT